MPDMAAVEFGQGADVHRMSAVCFVNVYSNGGRKICRPEKTKGRLKTLRRFQTASLAFNPLRPRIARRSAGRRNRRDWQV